MLSSSGPANIAGNSVSTSIFMASPGRQQVPLTQSPAKRRSPPYRHRSGLANRILFHNLKSAAQALLGAAGQEQRSDRIDGHSLASDYFSNVLGVQAQF